MTRHLKDMIRANPDTARAGVTVAVWTFLTGALMLHQAIYPSNLDLMAQSNTQFDSRSHQPLSIARALDLDRRAVDIALQKQRLDLLVNEDPAAPPILERNTLLELAYSDGVDRTVAMSVGGPLIADVMPSSPRPHPMPTSIRNLSDAITSMPAQFLPKAVHAISTQQTLAMIEDKFGPVEARERTSTGQLAWQFETAKDVEAIAANQAAALIWLRDEIEAAIADRIAILKKTGLTSDDVFTSISAIPLELLESGDVQVGGPLIEDAVASVDDDDAFNAIDQIERAQLDVGTTIQHNDEGLQQLAALNDVLMALPIRLPVAKSDVWVSSKYGYRRDAFTRHRAFHAGLDLAGNRGVQVKASAEGVVVYAGRKGAYGNLVAISHGYGIKTRYAHLSRIDVKVGDLVAVGTPIGTIGSTGRSTGYHLHYEVWYGNNSRDPLPFVEAGRELAKLIHQD